MFKKKTEICNCVHIYAILPTFIGLNLQLFLVTTGFIKFCFKILCFKAFLFTCGKNHSVLFLSQNNFLVNGALCQYDLLEKTKLIMIGCSRNNVINYC